MEKTVGKHREKWRFQWKTGWWYTKTPLKNIRVSWDGNSQLFLESHKIPWFQTTNQGKNIGFPMRKSRVFMGKSTETIEKQKSRGF